MKITNLRCIRIPSLRALIIRIDTDEGLYGLSQVEMNKQSFLAPVLTGHYKRFVLGLDPTDVERVMRRIRRLGAFKPWGAAVSAIEIALWDIAGKAAGLPVYKLLGGKVRDAVRAYMGAPPPFTPLPGYMGPSTPEGYHSRTRARLAVSGGMTIMKSPIGFRDGMWQQQPGYHYGIDTPNPDAARPGLKGEPGQAAFEQRGGMITERGLEHTVECAMAVKDALGTGISMALDCGPGWKVPGAIAFCRRIEHLQPLWLEDLITGDYSPFVNPQAYREVKRHTTAPLHTGEQVYLRQNFREMIEQRAVDVIGPDPLDVGGIAELKWIAEYADMHEVLIAPHGIGNGPFGLAAIVQVGATLPDNFLAFELPIIVPEWKDLITGIGADMIRDGHAVISEQPGLGVDLVDEAVQDLLGRKDVYTQPE